MHISGSATDGEIKLENQRLFNHRKAWHRLGIDVLTNYYATKVASLFYLRNLAILQDSCISDVGTITLEGDWVGSNNPLTGKVHI
jgi:hypothetical protein